MTAPPCLDRRPLGQKSLTVRLLECLSLMPSEISLAARADFKCVRPGPWGFREGSGS